MAKAKVLADRISITSEILTDANIEKVSVLAPSVLKLVDEKDDTKLVVYKCWLKYKGHWGYYCQRMSSLLYQICLLYENTIPRKSRVKFYEMNEVDPKGWVV